MAFSIIGSATAQRDSAIEALKCALEMLGNGHADVVIVDLAENGKAYAPVDFDQFYKDAIK